jgi:hypothetical protein
LSTSCPAKPGLIYDGGFGFGFGFDIIFKQAVHARSLPDCARSFFIAIDKPDLQTPAHNIQALAEVLLNLNQLISDSKINTLVHSDFD